MTEKPIIFSAPMVRAILEGRKTQTRRLLKPQPVEVRRNLMRFPDKNGFEIINRSSETVDALAVCDRLPYAPGDLLWVREAHSLHSTHGQHRDDGQRWGPWGGLPSQISPDGTQIAYYREGFDRCSWHRWRPSIHMPRWASRITLRVTDVRVQLLQDISGEDALAEGLEGRAGSWIDFTGKRDPHGYGFKLSSGFAAHERAGRAAFRELWNNLHGPGAWDANPWVAAYSFERVKT